ncbi:hypothetical protein ACFE04_014636 [Oxalis oulophora]
MISQAKRQWSKRALRRESNAMYTCQSGKAVKLRVKRGSVAGFLGFVSLLMFPVRVGVYQKHRSNAICKNEDKIKQGFFEGEKQFLSSIEVSTQEPGSDDCVEELSNEDNSQSHMHSSSLDNSSTIEETESDHTCTSNLETIFSPVMEPIEVHTEHTNNNDNGNINDFDVAKLGADDNTSSFDYHTCNVSDFFISDMIITNLSFDENSFDTEILDTNPFSDYKYTEPSMLYDVAEKYMILPFLEDTVKYSTSDDGQSHEEGVNDLDGEGLNVVISQLKPCSQRYDVVSNSDPAEDFDPQLFIKSLPELSDMVSDFHTTVSPKESRRKKTVTLKVAFPAMFWCVEETLVHSALEHCEDADFTFNVFFNMKEHTVYVKQRPYLHVFLERVAEMFEVMIFTASQSIYAEQLLNILDPDGKLISRRVYRESCIFSDGSYTKDLTVLGVDLSKVCIVDNSPQVFRLQVNNGIPIKSWFDDPTDCALISLLPFLETLVDANDVRPIIAKKFGNME